MFGNLLWKIWLKNIQGISWCRSEDQKIRMMTLSYRKGLWSLIIYTKWVAKADVDTDVDLKLLPHCHLINWVIGNRKVIEIV